MPPNKLTVSFVFLSLFSSVFFAVFVPKVSFLLLDECIEFYSVIRSACPSVVKIVTVSFFRWCVLPGSVLVFSVYLLYFLTWIVSFRLLFGCFSVIFSFHLSTLCFSFCLQTPQRVCSFLLSVFYLCYQSILCFCVSVDRVSTSLHCLRHRFGLFALFVLLATCLPHRIQCAGEASISCTRFGLHACHQPAVVVTFSSFFLMLVLNYRFVSYNLSCGTGPNAASAVFL